jgi:glutamate racemase
MVGPTVSVFRGSDARVALCATPATILSGIYQNAFRMIGKDIQAIPVPGLAGAIEFGKTETDIETSIREAFRDVDRGSFDVLVLACTHYPFAIAQFKNVLSADIKLFDPAHAVAARVEKQFWPREVGDGKTTFLSSAPTEQFATLIERLFPGKTYTVESVT